MAMGTLRRTGLLIAIAIAGLDQLSKWWIVEVVMQPPRMMPMTPFFNLVLGHNRGVSFGLFGTDESYAPYILSAVAALIVVALLIWLWRDVTRPVAVALGMIIGGAIGNVIDRLRIGAVVDFLDFHAAGYHWPAFNVADVGITVGAGLLILDSFLHREEQG